MATVSVGGLVSGINYDEMISKIIAAESQPIAMMQSRQADYNKKISVYGDLSSKLAALKTAADGLRTASSFYVKTASSSDATRADRDSGPIGSDATSAPCPDPSVVASRGSPRGPPVAAGAAAADPVRAARPAGSGASADRLPIALADRRSQAGHRRRALD